MKKFKLISAAFTTTTILGASSVFASSCSCSNADEQLAKEIIAKAVEEFVEIAKHPRPTFYTQKIREYLVQRIKDLGYEPKLGEPAPVGSGSDGQNIYFDVPANDESLKNSPKIILQGHMDMVVAGVPESQRKTTSIEVEYHEDTYTLTSKDNKTSLGADNGMGLGVIFAILQNEKIKHGPLRVLITYDEEKGMLGARNIDANIIDSNYLISLDGELPNEGYYRSCQGTIGYEYTYEFTTEQLSANKLLDIQLVGLKGGHSGNEINIGRANSNVLLLTLLQALNDSTLQMVRYGNWNDNDEDIPQNRNAIPNTSRVQVITNKTEKEIQDTFKQVKENSKTRYYGEDWDKVQLNIKQKATTQEPLDVKALSPSDTIDRFIDIVVNEDKGFRFGTYIEEESTKRPLLSCNIAPLTLKDGVMKVETYARSVSKLGIDTMFYVLPGMWYQYFDTKPKLAEPTYPWEKNPDDVIQKLAHKGYQSIGIEPTIRDTNGAVEPAWFIVKRPSLHQTCLGTWFEYVHTVNETCHLKPLKNTVKVLKYIFENLK